MSYCVRIRTVYARIPLDSSIMRLTYVFASPPLARRIAADAVEFFTHVFIRLHVHSRTHKHNNNNIIVIVVGRPKIRVPSGATRHPLSLSFFVWHGPDVAVISLLSLPSFIGPRRSGTRGVMFVFRCYESSDFTLLKSTRPKNAKPPRKPFKS